MTDKHPRGASGEKAHVEAYQLPRWDARGQPVKEPAKNRKLQQSEAEDVNPDSLKPPTASDIRQIHEDAYNEGFESGFEQGMKQGQATGQAEGYKAGFESGEQEGRSAGHKAGQLAAENEESGRISKELAPLALLLEDIKQILPQQSRDLEAGMVALASRIARNVIDAELALNPEHINELVHAAVQALPNADERFTLEINPDDAIYVNRIAEPHWNIVPTPAISRGGCLIRTRFSYVDYSLEHRYRQQVSNLLAHVGLSEQLTELEKPWPLPPSQTDAESQVGSEEPQEAESMVQEGVTGAEPSETVAQDEVTEPEPRDTEPEPRDTEPQGTKPEPEDTDPEDTAQAEAVRGMDVDASQTGNTDDSDVPATGNAAEEVTQAEEPEGQDVADEPGHPHQDDDDER
jgi:flagellar assembly protein FliH